jgi:transcriptional regulator with XRE-family HTH domain
MTLHELTWTLGDRLAKARKVAGISAQDMADELGVSVSMVSRYENDKSPLRRSYLRTWAQITGAPLDWLIEGDERPLGGADHVTDGGTRASAWNVMRLLAAA